MAFVVAVAVNGLCACSTNHSFGLASWLTARRRQSVGQELQGSITQLSSSCSLHRTLNYKGFRIAFENETNLLGCLYTRCRLRTCRLTAVPIPRRWAGRPG
ncbi:hypothetical protein DFP72DRAFT_137912 [Ephemerocybe angulata]|uniref:Uncharacterized protein n=1 Tax=Ephemerocybe angulata TaxID=980116 RepID=A0A8H6LW19_9AGAR|nr:hypothetical protein DFP72DRAFT_137912 [Tulosesus angulatus]